MEYGQVHSEVYNLSTWELMHTDRAETLSLLDHYLDEKLNMVTVQLGENASNIETFESDFEYLLDYISGKAPNAQIFVISDFWEHKTKDGSRDLLKKTAAENKKAVFVDISEIKDNKDYQCGTGTVVLGDDGKEHVVNHSGVAAHPNDKAMEYIALRIEEAMNTPDNQ